MPLIRVPPFRLVRHALKTALAVALSMILSTAVGLEHGMWAAISAVIVIQADLGSSIRSGVARGLGTLVGATIGIVSLYLGDPSVLLLSLAVLTVILLCACSSLLTESFRIAGITVAIVFMGGDPGQTPLAVGLDRCLEIVLGVGVSIVVAYFVWPATAAKLLREKLTKHLLETSAIMQLSVTRFLDGTEGAGSDRVSALVQATKGNRDLLHLVRRESGPRLGPDVILLGRCVETQERLVGHVRALERLTRSLPEAHFRVEAIIEVDEAMRTLLRRLAQAYLFLAGDISGRPEAGNIPALDPARQWLTNRLQELRSQSVFVGQPLDEVIQFFSLFEQLRAMTSELAFLQHALRRGR